MRALMLVVAASLLWGFVDVPADAEPVQATLRFRIGGGNLATHEAGDPSTQMYQALEGVGAKLGRMNSYGWRNLARAPTPQDFEAAMLEAYRHGITPMILFEYEGSYQFLSPPQPIGSRSDWFRIGATYARRFQPNGTWAREHGITDWGVTIFSAINEPDVQATIPRPAYHDALAGLAEGVHSVAPGLKVIPGGFATCNSHSDETLRGYGTAIADLLQDGHLDGIDLHTYYNARWFPLTKGHYFSAQSCFDRVKRTLKITRDIGFYATEFNIARDDAWSDPAVAASLFLTALWDELGVVGRDGHTPVTQLAFPWNLGDISAEPPYAMALGEKPWQPDRRAEVLRRVLKLAGDMTFVALDPNLAGTFVLSGPGGELHVWQDRPDWTDHPGTTWDVIAPNWADEAQLWDWRGKIRDIHVEHGHAIATDLAQDATYMMLFPTAGR